MNDRVSIVAFLVVVSSLIVGGLRADQQPPIATGSNFIAMDVFADSGSASLAAYQIEFACGDGARLVGVEGGEHTAFAEAPAYDPAALSMNRIIIAAFETSDVLPSGRTRIARLHLLVDQPVDQLRPSIRVHAAVNAEGEDISLETTIIPHEGTE